MGAFLTSALHQVVDYVQTPLSLKQCKNILRLSIDLKTLAVKMECGNSEHKVLFK